MKEDPSYRPNIPTDKNYLKGVASLIKNDTKEDINFDILNDIFRLLKITDNIYDDLNLDNLTTDLLQEKIKQAFSIINSRKIDDKLLMALYKAWDYLSESDPIEKADLIFVFGGANTQRVDEAVRLYKEKYSPLILFTGKKASYMKDEDITEADYYANIAIEKGVPQSALILEREAKNTPENVTNSYKILEEKNLVPSKVIIITLPYHMRRSYYTFKAGAKGNPVIIRDTISSTKFTRENYYKSEEGFNYICSEFIKMYGARLMGHF